MEPVDPRDVRISDDDRHRVAEMLRKAAGEGRLDIEELEQRLEATYAARTYGDLVPITLDLPGHGESTPAVREQHATERRVPRSPASTSATWNSSWALMSESTRSGVWDVGASHVATSVMGSVVIDLREARFPEGGEVVITASAVMGSVQVLLNYRTAVRVEGIGIMGAFTEHRSRYPSDLDDSSPLVRVRGVALMGAVEVRRKESDAEKRRRRELG